MSPTKRFLFLKKINPLFESELETLISSFEYYSLAKREDLFGKVRMFRLEKE
jgi:hypothetical protein